MTKNTQENQWTKISSARGRGIGRMRQGFAVRRMTKEPKVAKLLIPREFATGGRADLFQGAKGQIALKLGDQGDFVVSKISKSDNSSYQVTIPSDIAQKIKMGTNDLNHSVENTPDGDLIVFDFQSVLDHEATA